MSHLGHHNPQLKTRLRRISGQLAALERSLEDGADCSEILQQCAAARGAFHGFMDEILASYMTEHVIADDLSDAERAQGAQTLLSAIKRYQK